MISIMAAYAAQAQPYGPDGSTIKPAGSPIGTAIRFTADHWIALYKQQTPSLFTAMVFSL
jgi:hypothetical protein